MPPEEDPEDGEVPAEERAAPPEPASPLDRPEWAGLSNAEKKKKLKKMLSKVAKGKGDATDYYNVYGEGARASVEIKASKNPVKLEEVQDLIMWVLGDAIKPTWAFVKNKPLVTKMLVVFVGGLSGGVWAEHPEQLAAAAACLGEPAAAQGAPSATARPDESAACLLTSTTKASKKRKKGEVVDEVPEEPPFPPAYYLLTPQEMVQNNYPLRGGREPRGGGGAESFSSDLEKYVAGEEVDDAIPDGFVETQPWGAAGAGTGSAPPHRMLGMDCEMCYTEDGLTLTRVSLVSGAGEVVYDSLVLPEKPILDYNTQYSGITAEKMEGVTTRLGDVQAKMLQLVHAETMLVGHSLENDLRQTRVLHRAVLDTSLMYPHPRGPPYKPALRKLAEQFLGRTIQVGVHDSIDDARAALDLAKLKIARGPSFGEVTGRDPGESVCDILGRGGRRVTLVDRRRFLHRQATGSTAAIPCTTDDEVVIKASKEIRKGATGSSLVWAGLAELCSHWDARALRARQGELDAASEGAALEGVLERTAGRLRALFDAAEDNTLVVVASGAGDTAEVRRLQERKWRRQRGVEGPPWEDASEEELKKAQQAAKDAVVFAVVKGSSGVQGGGGAAGATDRAAAAAVV